MPVGGQAHARLVTARFSSAQTLYFGYVGGAILTGADGTSVVGNPALAVNVTTTPFLIPTTNLLPPTPITTQSGATYTYAVGDAQTWVRFTNASGCTVTIPMGVFPVGTQLVGEAATSGVVQFLAAAGVTLQPASPVTAIAQTSVVSFMQVATDTWVAYGEKM